MEYQIVADENVDFRIISHLRQLGFNVYSIAEQQPSITDEAVLITACEMDALLISGDKDFGFLVFRLQLPHRGILLIRIDEAELKIPAVAQAISEYYSELHYKFSVLNGNKLRIRQ
jgi:hypothetical protein